MLILAFLLQSLSGRTFQGFKSGTSPDTAILAELGLDRTLGDWYDLINIEIPDPVYRATKHYATGHSLGGPLTACFGAYDRDGNATTTHDAGYNQAAGFIAYDSTLNENFPANRLPEVIRQVIQPIVDVGFEASLAGFRSGLLPRSLLTALPIVLNSEAVQLLSILGARAVIDAKGEADLQGLPRTKTIVTAAQFFFSKTFTNFITFFPVSNMSGLCSIPQLKQHLHLSTVCPQLPRDQRGSRWCHLERPLRSRHLSASKCRLRNGWHHL